VAAQLFEHAFKAVCQILKHGSLQYFLQQTNIPAVSSPAILCCSVYRQKQKKRHRHNASCHYKTKLTGKNRIIYSMPVILSSRKANKPEKNRKIRNRQTKQAQLGGRHPV
jgi:glutaminase